MNPIKKKGDTSQRNEAGKGQEKYIIVLVI